MLLLAVVAYFILTRALISLQGKEAIEYVNQVAPKNATVSVWWKFLGAVSSYARPDLKLMSMSYVTEDPGFPFDTQIDYAILPTRSNADQFYFPASKEIYLVQRGGALLSVVKQVEKGDLIQDKYIVLMRESQGSNEKWGGNHCIGRAHGKEGGERP